MYIDKVCTTIAGSPYSDDDPSILGRHNGWSKYECEQRCMATSRCVAYEYFQVGKGRCHLRTACPFLIPVQQVSVETGVRVDADQPVTIPPGVKRPGACVTLLFTLVLVSLNSANAVFNDLFYITLVQLRVTCPRRYPGNRFNHAVVRNQIRDSTCTSTARAARTPRRRPSAASLWSAARHCARRTTSAARTRITGTPTPATPRKPATTCSPPRRTSPPSRPTFPPTQVIKTFAVVSSAVDVSQAGQVLTRAALIHYLYVHILYLKEYPCRTFIYSYVYISKFSCIYTYTFTYRYTNVYLYLFMLYVQVYFFVCNYNYKYNINTPVICSHIIKFEGKGLTKELVRYFI